MNKLEHEVLGSYFDQISQRAEHAIKELQLLQNQLKEIKQQLKVTDEAPLIVPKIPLPNIENTSPPVRNNPNDLIRIKEVIAMTGVSRSFIYHHRKTGTFPSPIHLSSRSVAWVRSSIDDWIKSKVTNQ